jgi:hypothetical protein
VDPSSSCSESSSVESPCIGWLVAPRPLLRLLPAGRPCAAPRSSSLVSQEILQHLEVERLIRHDPLQPPVLVFQLLQAPGLRSIQPSVLLPPPIERCLRDPLASSNLCDLGTGVRFLQDADDLLVGESTLSHGLLRLGNPIITGSGSGGHLTSSEAPRRSPPQPRGHGGLQWRRRESNPENTAPLYL